MRLGNLALILLVGVGLAPGCGKEPREIEKGELPASLAEALPALEAAGYEARAMTTGPLDTPTIVVAGEPLTARRLVADSRLSSRAAA